MGPCLEVLEDRTLPSNQGTTSALITAIPNANTSGGATAIPLAPGATFDVAPRPSGLGAYLLACAAALLYCAGLVALAVLPSLAVTVPRAVILAYGVHCTLLALLAPLLGRPWQPLPAAARQRHRHPKRGGTGGGWAADWKGPRASARARALLKSLANSAALDDGFPSPAPHKCRVASRGVDQPRGPGTGGASCEWS
jgi:hypothetical protein